MTKSLLMGAFMVLLLLPGICRNAPAQDIAIAHINVYASPEAPLQTDMTILIRHGVIATVTKQGRIPGGVQTLSCDGCFLTAGFWNAHGHFMEPKWNDAAHQPADKLTQQMDEMLTRSGFVLQRSLFLVWCVWCAGAGLLLWNIQQGSYGTERDPGWRRQ